MRRTGGLSGRERPGPESRSRGPAAAQGCELRQWQLPAARGRCARRRAPGTSAGSFLSELQFQCMPRLQHPLRPPPATTFNSPGGLRGSPAGRQRDSGCRREGGAQERRLPQCASSFLGKERAALSSRSPRDCSLDVTPHPPTHTPRWRGAEGGVQGARTRECERECESVCVCVHARVCPARLGTGWNRSWILRRARN